MDANRISVSAIGALQSEDLVFIQFGEATVSLKRKIPYQEILDLVQLVVDFSITDQPILSGVVKNIALDMAIVKYYTNLDCAIFEEGTELEKIYKEYGILVDFGVIDEVKAKMDSNQKSFIEKTVTETLSSIIDYRNSARGIIDSLAASAADDSGKMQSALDMFNGENGERLASLIQFSHEIAAPAQ